MVTELLPGAYVIMRMVRPSARPLCLRHSVVCDPHQRPCWRKRRSTRASRSSPSSSIPTEQPLEPSELHDILPLQKDQPLRMADVRASIERLFATGRYADIQVDAEPYSDGTRDGVIVRFLTKNSWFIGAVTLPGASPARPTPANWRTPRASIWASPTPKPSSRTAVAEPAAAARKQRPVPQPASSPLSTTTTAYQQVNIRFDVTSGPRARFTTPVLLGDLKMDPRPHPDGHQVPPLDHPHLEAGDADARAPGPGRRPRALPEGEPPGSQGLARIHEVRSADQPRAAHAAHRRRAADRGEHHRRQDLQEKLQRYVPIFEEHAVDHDLLVEGARNLRTIFQSQGYFDAEVEFKEQRVINDQATIDYLINTGDASQTGSHRDHRQQVLHHGDHPRAHVPADRVLPAVSARPLQREPAAPRRGFHRQPVPVERLPRRQGDAPHGGQLSRKARRNRRLSDDRGRAAIVRQQPAGGRHRASGPCDKSCGSLSSCDGQPFSEFNVAVDRDTILAQYFDKGFPNATFEWSSKPAAEPNRVDLRFAIHEGQQQFVRQVLTSGLKTTRPEPGGPQPARSTRAIRSRPPRSPRPSGGCTTWASSRAWMPPSRTPTARPTASTCSTTWTKRGATPWPSGFGAELGRIGGCNDLPGRARRRTGFSPARLVRRHAQQPVGPGPQHQPAHARLHPGTARPCSTTPGRASATTTT